VSRRASSAAVGGPALLGVATGAALLAGAACTAAGAVSGGGRGALSAGLATGLVLSFLWAGQLPVAQAARGRKVLGTALLLFGYTARVALLLLAFRLFAGADFLDRRTFGVAVVVTALTWTAGALWTLLRWRAPNVETDDATGEGVGRR
jgi:hypothetical protein